MEQGPTGVIEAEIAELSKKIEEKRRILEAEKGIVEEREVVRQAIGEKVGKPISSSAPSSQKPVSGGTQASYLDSVGQEVETEVNSLLEIVFSRGIDSAMSEAEKKDPLIMDAFHDALVDKVYDELKAKGIVK